LKERHNQKIEAAMLRIGRENEASPKEIVEEIQKQDSGINVESFKSDLIAYSINHTSSCLYPHSPKFLFFNAETKKYRLATEKELSAYEREHESENKNLATFLDGMPVITVPSNGRIVIPREVSIKMGLKPGETLAFIKNDKGEISIKRGKIRFEFEG